MLSQKYIKSLLRYDPVTGYLYWLTTRTNSIKKGKRAGSLHPTGYIRIEVDKKKYAAHRLIWLIQYGKFPLHQIDHINGIRHDNCLKNLRTVTRQENFKNQRIAKNNKSGLIGVYWNKNIKKWHARIGVNKTKIHLGYFDDWFDAVCARKSADIIYKFHKNHGR